MYGHQIINLFMLCVIVKTMYFCACWKMTSNINTSISFKTYIDDMCESNIYCTASSGTCTPAGRPYDGTPCGDLDAVSCNKPFVKRL